MRFLSDRPVPDETEIAAGNILGAVVVFLLLQVPIVFLFLILSHLLPALGTLSPAVGLWLGFAVALLAETALILYLTRTVRRRISGPVDRKAPTIAMRPTDEGSEFEKRLERMILVGALVATVAALLMGLGSFGARVALMVVEAFAVLFLIVTIATRWFLTRRVSTVALLALGVTLLSVGLATGLIRR